MEKTSRKASITAVGHFVPADVYPNAYFEDKLETTDDWIRSRTGISERRFDFNAPVSDLLVAAAEQCIAQRGIDRQAIDFIICATITPDHMFPSTACIVQRKLGINNAWGFDLSAACSGFLFALETARRMVESGGAKCVLICSGDRMSSILNFEDRTTAVLFGDGAGAVLVEASDDPEIGIEDSILHIDGTGGEFLYMPAGGSRKPTTIETVQNREHYVVQDGRSVFKAAVVGMADVSAEIMQRNNLTADDVQWLVPHQANLRIIDATAERMGLDKNKIMVNIHRYGNTTAGTIPLCLSEWQQHGKIAYGDRLILSSFGAGYTWGSVYLRWGIR